MERRLLYIINPIAGTRGKKNLQELVSERCRKRQVWFRILPSVPDGDYNFLFPVITEDKITDVIVAGGDGTVNQVVGALRNLPVRFGILPCGSGNGLAYSAGIPSSIEKALELVFTGSERLTDAFLVNGRFACMLCGLGFDAQVAHDFARQAKRGLITYVQQVLRNFRRAKHYPFELLVGEQRIRTEAFFISVANSNQFGNHFTIAPKASLEDGLLDIVVVTRQNKGRLLWSILQQIRGKNPFTETRSLKTDQGILYFQTPALRILNPAPAPLHVDGEPADTARELSIAVLPGCFRLIRKQ